eukprot:11432333-Karenia_brevis.AAC.1
MFRAQYVRCATRTFTRMLLYTGTYDMTMTHALDGECTLARLVHKKSKRKKKPPGPLKQHTVEIWSSGSL